MSGDRRNFTRRNRKVLTELEIAGERHAAEIVDYSLGGFCAELDGGAPGVEVGERVSVTSAELGIRCSGRVVWKRKARGGALRLGLDRTGQLSGQLRDFAAPDILAGLHRSGRSGILYVTSGKLQRKIYLSEGKVTAATSNGAWESPAAMLANRGLITAAQMGQAAAVEKLTGQPPIEIFSSAGGIRREDVIEAVGESARAVICGFFQLREGQFVLVEDSQRPARLNPIGIPTPELIFVGVMSITDPGQIESMRPEASGVPALTGADCNCIPEEAREVLTACNGRSSAAEILAAHPADEQRVIKVLHAASLIGLIDYPREGGGEDEFADRALALHSNLRELGYYGVLGLNKGASKADIKRAFYAKVVEFHPDRHVSLDEHVREKLNEIFAFITSAYNTLNDDALRGVYDREGLAGVAAMHDPASKANRKFDEGREAFRRGRLDEAARAFNEAIDFSPGVHQFHFALGQLHHKAGRLKEAEAEYRKALSLDPQNPQYLAESGHVFLELGYPARARGYFERALRMDPADKRSLEGISILGPKRSD